MALQAAFRTGSMFEACDDLLQTGDAYSAEEKHRARAVVRIVLVFVPQLLVFANLLRMLFLTPVFALVLAMWSLYVRHRSRVAPKTGHRPNKYEVYLMTPHYYIKSHQNLLTLITLCLPKLTKLSLTDKLRAHIVTCMAHR